MLSYVNIGLRHVWEAQADFPKGAEAWAVLRNPFSDLYLPHTLEPKTVHAPTFLSSEFSTLKKERPSNYVP